MPTLHAYRKGDMLVPDDTASAIELSRLPFGRTIRIEARVPRHGKHHRGVWKLFALTAQALNDGPSPGAAQWTSEGVAELVKIGTGHVEYFKLRPKDAKRYGTDVGIRPASISFEAMDQSDFDKFSDAALVYIRSELCPYIETSPYWVEINRLITKWHGEAAA